MSSFGLRGVVAAMVVGLALFACAEDDGAPAAADSPIVENGASTNGAGAADGGAPVTAVKPATPAPAPSTFTVFHTNVIAGYEACKTAQDDGCADADADGLNDAWEDAVLAHFRPALEFDEQERGLGDKNFKMGIAGRVVARKEAPARIVVFFGLLYSEDYGSCTFTDHHGDIERVVLELERIEGTAGDVRWVKAFTAAHEGDPTDASHTASSEQAITKDLEAYANEDGSTRWLVYTSRNKHGSYISKGSCESKKIPCLADYCGGGSERAKYQRLLDVLNAGEPEKPRDANWSKFGYPNADAWSTKPFCGIATSGDCDEEPRGTFVKDPFTKKEI